MEKNYGQSFLPCPLSLIFQINGQSNRNKTSDNEVISCIGVELSFNGCLADTGFRQNNVSG